MFFFACEDEPRLRKRWRTMSNALVLFGKIFGGAAKMTNYLRAAAASPADFINVGKINQAEGYRLVSFTKSCQRVLFLNTQDAHWYSKNTVLRAGYLNYVELFPLSIHIFSQLVTNTLSYLVVESQTPESPTANNVLNGFSNFCRERKQAFPKTSQTLWWPRTTRLSTYTKMNCCEWILQLNDRHSTSSPTRTWTLSQERRDGPPISWTTAYVTSRYSNSYS